MVALNSRFLLLAALAASAANPAVLPGADGRAVHFREGSRNVGATDATDDGGLANSASMSLSSLQSSTHLNDEHERNVPDNAHQVQNSPAGNVKLEAKDPRHSHRFPHHNHPRSRISGLPSADYGQFGDHSLSGNKKQMHLAARRHHTEEILDPLLHIGPLEIGSMGETEISHRDDFHRHNYARSSRSVINGHGLDDHHEHPHVHTHDRRRKSDYGGEKTLNFGVDMRLDNQDAEHCVDRHGRHVSCRNSRGFVKEKRDDSGGVQGTVDIVSLGTDGGSSNVIAHLILKQVNGATSGNSSSSSNATDGTEPTFVLDASNSTGTPFLLFAEGATDLNTTNPDGKKNVRLQYSVYDPKQTAMEPFCVTFDPQPPAPAPLLLQHCFNNSALETAHKSQIFVYDTGNNIIAPKWANASSTAQTAAGSTKEREMDFSVHPSVKDVPANSSSVNSQSITLMFHPSVTAINTEDMSEVSFEPSEQQYAGDGSTTASDGTDDTTDVPTSTDTSDDSTSSDTATAAVNVSDTASVATDTSSPSSTVSVVQNAVQATTVTTTVTSPMDSATASSSDADASSSSSSDMSGAVTTVTTTSTVTPTSSSDMPSSSSSSGTNTVTATATVTIDGQEMERMFNAKQRLLGKATA